MSIPQQQVPAVSLLAQPIFLVDSNGNPLSLSTVASNVNLNQVGGSAFATGQQTMANSIGVALASDQASIPVTSLTADLTVVAAGSHTTTQTQSDQTNVNARGLRVVLDMTDVTASPSVTLEIDAKDVASGKYVSLLTGSAVVTVSTNVYLIHPSLTAAANSIAQNILPRTWRIKATANNSNAGVYSVGASYLL